jgi:hypothetical protein
VGRHAADDEAGVHPIVAAALQQRPATALPGSARHDAEGSAMAVTTDGGLGWPGEPADGTGLGWPEDPASGTQDAAQQPAPADGEPARRRPGWRRFLGSGRAA